MCMSRQQFRRALLNIQARVDMQASALAIRRHLTIPPVRGTAVRDDSDLWRDGRACKVLGQ